MHICYSLVRRLQQVVPDIPKNIILTKKYLNHRTGSSHSESAVELLHEVEAVGGEEGEVGHQAAVLPIRGEDCGHVISWPPVLQPQLTLVRVRGMSSVKVVRFSTMKSSLLYLAS